MLSATQIRGCYPAIITPMIEESGRVVVDVDKYHELIAHFIDAGVTGIVIAGTTGQSATLTHNEQIELVSEGALYARGYAAGKGREVQIIASAGSNATHEAVEMSRAILAEGRVDALLHVSGYYNNPPQEGLLRHFRIMADLAGENDASIILYNVPSRTKSNIEADTTIELAQHPAIVAIKEASGDLNQVGRILDETDRENFTVVSGEDHMVYDIMKLGGTGVISASANVWPQEFQVLTELCAAGEWEKAEELQKALQPCVDACFCVKNPIALHHMLDSEVRLPLVKVGDLREPGRSKAIATIDKALAITEFPHVGKHVGPLA